MKRRFSYLALFTLLFLAACAQISQYLPALAQPTALPAAPVADQPTPVLPQKLVVLDSPTPSQQVAVESTSTPTPVQKPREQVWAINEDDRTVFRVDPETHQIMVKVQMTGRPIDLVVGEGSVWVLEAVDNSRSNVVKIDPAINQAIFSIPITYGAGMAITSGGGAVWVGVAEPVAINQLPEGIDYNQTGGVVRINAADNAITDYIKTGAIAADLFYFQKENALWVLEWVLMYSYVDRIVYSENEFVLQALPEVPGDDGYIHQFSHIAVNEAGIWATPLEDNSHYIYHLDPANGNITGFIEVGLDDTDNPVDLTATQDSVWVALRSGSVTRVDPVEQKAVEQIPVGGNLSQIFLASDQLWALSRQDALLYQINLQTGEVYPPILTGNKPRPTATITSTLIPTLEGAVGAWKPCENTYTSNLHPGMQAMVNPEPPLSNRVREAPGIHQTMVGSIEPHEIVAVLDGPSCVEGWVWWRVKSVDTGIEGWTSEGDNAGYWLIPLP